MIITKTKDFKHIVDSVGKGPVFIAGCSECATLCHTGGEKEVLAMKKALEKEKIAVSGWVVLDPACHLNNDKRMLKDHKDELAKTKKVLALSCGNGVQTVSEIVDVDVVSGTDTLFLGEIKRATEFAKRCNLCGDCVVDNFVGFCPISRCPKHIMNGPCGGSTNGKCEIDSEMDCVWELIYKGKKNKGKKDALREIQPPKKWSKSLEMQRRA